jgi:hypothetical protein
MRKVALVTLSGLLVLFFMGTASAKPQTSVVTIDGLADFFGFPVGPDAKVDLKNHPPGFAKKNRKTETDAIGYYRLQDPGIRAKSKPHYSQVKVVWKLLLFGGAVCLKFIGEEQITIPAQLLPGQVIDINQDISLWFDDVCN